MYEAGKQMRQYKYNWVLRMFRGSGYYCLKVKSCMANSSIPTILGLKYVGSITSAQTGCWSYVGFVADFNLQPGNPGCLNVGKGTAEHEMLHALGTYNEQSRPEEVRKYFEFTVHKAQNAF